METRPNYMFNEPDHVPYDDGEDDLYEDQQQEWDSHGETHTPVNEHGGNVRTFAA